MVGDGMNDRELSDWLIDFGTRLHSHPNVYRYGVTMYGGTLDDLADIMVEGGKRIQKLMDDHGLDTTPDDGRMDDGTAS